MFIVRFNNKINIYSKKRIYLCYMYNSIDFIYYPTLFFYTLFISIVIINSISIMIYISMLINMIFTIFIMIRNIGKYLLNFLKFIFCY